VKVELRPARSLSPAERVDIFNAAYEGYVIPFQLDEATLDVMTHVFDLDLDASKIAFHDGEPIGLGNLALRGSDAWIGGVGVVTSARRNGIGQILMRALHQEAAARGVTHVWLEVIEQNDAAYRLYDKLGYRTVRDVEVWSLPAGAKESPAREVPAAQARARIHALRRTREPWQRADATLEHYDDLRGLETDGGAALFRISRVVQIQQIAGDDPDALLRTLRSHGTVTVLNLPADDPAADSLRALGGTASVRQHEMVLDLRGQG
jgi:GNAT superfamily N-acetyltransferase